ncbi:hypothetical protein L3Y34_006718 [Caenorhabditis briggsae]|nr:hypothetical protein L3Y34_006718 [Caenorhabditis briggsae]
MESNGEASLIHMSEIAHSLLSDHFLYQYETNSRGEVIIKGKGVMETFWLLGRLSMSNRSTPPVAEVKNMCKKRSSFPDHENIRSVSPYSEIASDSEDEEMRRIMRREMMRVG